MSLRYLFLAALIGGSLLTGCREKPKTDVPAETQTAIRWTETRANAWYQDQPWPVGANFVPKSAINPLEMWQADTFDPNEIDVEFGWAEKLGFNTMRVFLHDRLWKQDSTGLLHRMETYLDIADSHGIKTMFVLLDDVWNPYPKLGKQPEPRPHVHNSGWVQSPGKEVLMDTLAQDRLQGYIQGVLAHFKEDARVLVWDLYNEPGNKNGSSYGPEEPENKEALSLRLLQKVYGWARAINPSQPLTIGVWTSVKKEPDAWSAIDRFAYEHSDVISFHCYDDPVDTQKFTESLAVSGRPLFCTEYMARPAGSTFEGILPIFKAHRVAAYNWGFVDGKSQTIYPWDSWKKEYDGEPPLWFHDIFRGDGTPYLPEETALIKKLTGR